MLGFAGLQRVCFVQVLQDHEDALIAIRERLANPPATFLPEDPVKVRQFAFVPTPRVCV